MWIVLIFSILLAFIFAVYIPDYFITYEYNTTIQNISNETYIYKVEDLYIK